MNKTNLKKVGAITLLLGAFIIFGGAGCTGASDGSYSQDAAKVEETQKRVQSSVPIPEIKTSAERKNISARAVLFDNESLVTYIYLTSFGKVMAFYPVKGKVSSLNSYLTPLDKIVRGTGDSCNDGDYGSCGQGYVVSAPDIDGAYGQNAEGIFFFTTEGAYVEWNGDYLVSSQALKLTTQPDLIREIK